MAFDPESGKPKWKFELAQNGLQPGVLATAGGVDQPGIHKPGIIVSSAALQGDDGLLVTYTGATP